MKYAIEGFSQAKLLEYNLDILDAFLLRWFADFIASGSMKQTIKNGRIYYWIHYPTVIKELPAMGINNTKSIALRFEKYICCGILDKEIIHTQKGANVYYAIVESIFRSLLYTPESSHSNENSYAESHKNKNSSAHGNQNSCAEKTDSELSLFTENTPENNEKYEESEENPRNSDDFLPKNDTEKADFSPGSPHSNKNSSAEPHKNQNSCAHGNQNSCAHRNENSSALNDSTTKDSSIKDTATTSEREEKKAAAVILYLKNEFSKFLNPELFSSDFWPPFVAAIQSIPHNEWACYIAFLFDYTAQKKPQSAVNYIYRIAAKPFMLAAFFDNKIKKETALPTEIKKQHCIVCGSEYAGFICPICGFDRKEAADEEKVTLAKAIYALPEEKREELNKELEECFKAYGFKQFSKYQEQEKIIYQKYGVKK